MFKKLVLLFAICSWSALTIAQLDLRSATDFLTEDPVFDKNFMQQRRVLKIIAKPSEKRTLQEIIPLEKYFVYHFDRFGRMIKKEIIYTDNIELRDPKQTRFTYDDVGNLQSEQIQEYNSFFTDYYEYDFQGRVKVKSTYRETGSLGSDGNVLVENRQLVNKKNYSYQPIANGVKKHYHNNYGRIYKYDITKFNDDGTIISEQTKYIGAKNYAYKNFYYQNRLPIKVEVNENGRESELTVNYDSQGRLLKQDVYVGNSHQFTTDYIYDDKGLLNAQIRMDHLNEYMLIYQYEYVFY